MTRFIVLVLVALLIAGPQVAVATSLPIRVSYTGMTSWSDGRPPMIIYSIVIGNTRIMPAVGNRDTPEYVLEGEAQSTDGWGIEGIMWTRTPDGTGWKEIHYRRPKDAVEAAKYLARPEFFYEVKMTGSREILPIFMAKYSDEELRFVDFVITYRKGSGTRIYFLSGLTFEQSVSLAERLE